MPTVPKWLIESNDPEVTGDGKIGEVIRETPKGVLAVVKYPIGTGKESSTIMWIPKSQIDKVKDELSEIEFTPEGQI